MRQRIYSGVYGAAAFQSVYRGGGYAWDVAHQVGVPIAALAILSAPLAVIWTALALPSIAAALFLVSLALGDSVWARPPRRLGRWARLRFRLSVAGLHLMQPLARAWGRHWRRSVARRDFTMGEAIPGPVKKARGGVLLLPLDRPRPAVTEAIVAALRRNGLRVVPARGWERYDARLIGSFLVRGDLFTSAHPAGWLQVRVRRHLAVLRALLWLVAATLLAMHFPVSLAGSCSLAALDLGRGLWRLGPGARRAIAKRAGALRVAPAKRDHRPLAPEVEVVSS